MNLIRPVLKPIIQPLVRATQAVFGGGAAVPAGAITTDAGDPITTDAGDYIIEG